MRYAPLVLLAAGCMEMSPFQAGPLVLASNIAEPNDMLIDGGFL
jgi:hypothetical protein